MTIGVYTLELHLYGARSLKEKRKVVRRIKDRLRSHYNVAVGELGEHANLWQRAALVVVSVASNANHLQKTFEAVHRDVSAFCPGDVVELGSEFIDGSDGGPRGWSEGWA